MKKNSLLFVLFVTFSFSGFAQINKDQLALDVSKVDAENTEKLKAYVWKLHADILGEGGNKTTLISEMRYDAKGELTIKVVDGETNMKQKPGLRGKVQQNAVENKLEYVSKAMKQSLAYTYMTKGQLLDFFNKAVLTEKDGVLMAIGKNVYVEGDQLIIRMDAKSKYFLSKSFSTKLGENPLTGEVQYETFKSSGINHISTTKLEIPSEKITINGENKDYTIKVD
jgi:hypothetical protein